MITRIFAFAKDICKKTAVWQERQIYGEDLLIVILRYLLSAELKRMVASRIVKVTGKQSKVDVMYVEENLLVWDMIITDIVIFINQIHLKEIDVYKKLYRMK